MRNIEDQFEDIEIYDPSYSAGGINAYYMSSCEVVGHRPAYCICVNKIQAVQRDGKLPPNEPCENQIKYGGCKAVAMRNEELKEGRALFFINRTKLKAFKEEQDKKNGLIIVGETKPRRQFGMPVVPSIQPAKPAAPKHFLDIEGDGYAAALNAAIAASPAPSTKPVAQPEPPQQPKPVEAPATVAHAAPAKAGMSILELARMKLAAQKSQLESKS